MFIRVHPVRPGAPWVSLGSFTLVRFIRVHPGCRLVSTDLAGSSGCALGVAGFIRVRLVSSREPCGSLGSSRFV